MIACDYCGRENSDTATNCRECGTELSRCIEPEPTVELPTQLPTTELVRAAALEEFFSFEAGFHRADWHAIERWIKGNVSPINTEAAYNEAALLWVTKLRDDLGGRYFVHQSNQTILLCDQPLETARWLLWYAGQVATKIMNQLGDTAWAGATGKDALLVFSDQDDYYLYLSHHSPDGTQAGSGGVCIHSGYTHIAMPWHGGPDEAANTIVHELTHDCLAHLPLPVWLNEGIAVTLQKAIAPPERGPTQSAQTDVWATAINWRAPIMWDELAERHFAFWDEENIQTFWAGTSFYIPGDSNELSYSLAEVLVKLLTERGNLDTFRLLVATAHQNDAGQTASLEILGADLGEMAGTFLGDGNWRPQRKAMVAWWEIAGWNKGDESSFAPTV